MKSNTALLASPTALQCAQASLLTCACGHQPYTLVALLCVLPQQHFHRWNMHSTTDNLVKSVSLISQALRKSPSTLGALQQNC